jgi:hypothetical protein
MQQCDDGRRARLGSRADSIRVAFEGSDMTFSLKRALCGAMLAGFALTVAAQTPVPSRESTSSDDGKRELSVEELVKLKQNPVSGLRQVVFQANVNPNYPESGKTQGIYSLQVVWPFSLNDDYRLVTYTILSQYSVPGAPGESTLNGLGDTLINLFVSP